MAKQFVLRMRRMLDNPIAAPAWPFGMTLKTLGERPDKQLAAAAHSVLEAGYWEGGGGAPAFRQWWKAVRKDEEFDPSLVFLAMDEKGVAGMAQCWRSAFVKDLAVHPRARSRGVGRALLLTTFHAFAQRGATQVDLKVREDNATAIALYRSLGMTIFARELI